ncbi:MAG TPA: glycerophosphodiester phosphodiesterase family protein [Rhizomicrobium sp.]|nr:glycerophosphodiester phosphodiesterase family protein [Rhizomicrobium sp.]
MRSWIIAHRGGASVRPENTLCAFAHAVNLGCDGAELDVQLSRDGEVMVFHDLHLKPELCRDGDKRWLSAAAPRFRDLSFRELRMLDVGRADPGSEYARQHADVLWRDDECIPLLSEVIAVAKTSRSPFRLFVELKTSFIDRAESASPEQLAARTIEEVEEHGFLARCVFVGFDWPVLIHVKRMAPQAQCWFSTMPASWFADDTPPAGHDPPPQPVLQVLRTWAREGVSPWAAGYDAVRHGGSLIAAAKSAGADGWFPMWVDINAETIAQARASGLRIGAWTVNNVAAMRRLAELGIDAICTDRPDLLKAMNGEQ